MFWWEDPSSVNNLLVNLVPYFLSFFLNELVSKLDDLPPLVARFYVLWLAYSVSGFSNYCSSYVSKSMGSMSLLFPFLLLTFYAPENERMQQSLPEGLVECFYPEKLEMGLVDRGLLTIVVLSPVGLDLKVRLPEVLLPKGCISLLLNLWLRSLYLPSSSSYLLFCSFIASSCS